jgi:tetratricopeptide (TPR) repeat protein
MRAEGHVDEAINAYKRLLAVNPALPESWYNLGWLQRQARQFDDALLSYGRALDFHVGQPEEVHLNRAVIYSDHLHRSEDAERELRAALAKNADYVPALLNLGNLYEDLGNGDQARTAYEKVLAINPKDSLALARLAGVSHSPELDPKLADRLRVAIDRRDYTASERADLGFALAGLLDGGGLYDEAFAAVAAANAASKNAAGARYDRLVHERSVDRLISAFDLPVCRSEPESIAPVFICGMFRSGSTLVEQILASHSRVTSGGELDLIPFMSAQIPNYPEAVAEADAPTVAGWKAQYLRGLPRSPDRIVIDKRPDNFLHIGLIKTIFPSARIVHTRRNPLDNLLSLYFLHLDPAMAYALDLEDAAHWYGEYRRLMAHWKELYPHEIFDVDYDELVREPRAVVGGLFGFLRLEWEQQVLEFHRARAAVKTASVWQVRQALHARSSGRWRNYRTQLGSILPLQAQRD